jgi:hypothetical protein
MVCEYTAMGCEVTWMRYEFTEKGCEYTAMGREFTATGSGAHRIALIPDCASTKPDTLIPLGMFFYFVLFIIFGFKH